MIRFLAPIALTIAPAAALANTPQDIVDSHAAAYQARNMDAFLAHYAPDAQVHMQGMIFRGRDQIRAAYRLNFAPDAPRTQVIKRFVDGNLVTDVEQIILPDGSTMCCSTAIYTVRAGKISRVLLGFEDAG